MAKATKSYVTEVYIPCSGNNVVEITIDYIDEELIEWHSGNRKSAEGPKILAIEKACKQYRQIKRYLVACLQLSTVDNSFR